MEPRKSGLPGFARDAPWLTRHSTFHGVISCIQEPFGPSYSRQRLPSSPPVPVLGQAGPALAAQQLSADNPFARPSTLPYQLPPFDHIKDADFRPAFDAGMAEQRKEIEAMDRNPAPPSFENTVVALEKSGQLLDRVRSVFFNLNGSNTNPEMQKIESEMAPVGCELPLAVRHQRAARFCGVSVTVQ
jgi:hypothetical protein